MACVQTKGRADGLELINVNGPLFLDRDDRGSGKLSLFREGRPSEFSSPPMFRHDVSDVPLHRDHMFAFVGGRGLGAGEQNVDGAAQHVGNLRQR